jgi:membrane-bound lytic murein transglycosylase D
MKQGRIFLMALLAVGLASCGVSESDYQKVASERDDLQEQLNSMQKESNSLKERVASLQGDNRALGEQLEKLKGELAKAQREASAKAVAKKEPPESKTSPKREPTPAKGRTYEVQRGDNLWTISKKTGVPIDTLKKLNNVSPNQRLQVGQKIKLAP